MNNTYKKTKPPYGGTSLIDLGVRARSLTEGSTLNNRQRAYRSLLYYHTLMNNAISKILNFTLSFLILIFAFYIMVVPSAMAGTIIKSPAYLGLQNGLVGCWTFDGSYDKAPDCSGNNNTGTLTNGPKQVVGRLGQALSFDGVNDYVTMGNAASLNALPAITISAWVKRGSNSFGAVAGKYGGGGFLYYVGSAGVKPRLYIDGGSVDATNFISSSKWEHVVVTYNQATVSHYLNGLSNGSGALANGPINGNASAFLIGQWVTENWNGSLDDVRIYNRALGATEIARLYKIGLGSKQNEAQGGDQFDNGLVGHWTFDGSDISGTRAKDRSGNVNHGTLTNGPIQAIGRLGQAINFDGVNDKITVLNATSLKMSGTLTMTAWIYIKSISLGSDWNAILMKGSYTNNGYGFLFQDTAVNGAGVLRTYIPGIGTLDATPNFKLNTWYHVAATASSDARRVYINGVQVASGSGGTVSVGTQTLNIADDGSYYFAGSLDDIRIYNRVLSAGEMSKLYQMGQPKVNVTQNTLDKGLVGHWTFDGADISGTRAKDRSGNVNHGTLTNGPKQIIGRIGQALGFDGTNDYIDVGTGPTSVNTISFWAYPQSTTGYFVNLTSTTDYIWADSGTVTATGLTSPTIYVNGVVSSTIVANQWQFVTVTTNTSENASNLDIARTADTNYFQGNLDDVRVYNRALSAAEINKLYQMGR